MSSLHHRNDTGLLLKQLKQLNDLDHTEYYWLDFFHWFPTKEDETNAETTPPENRTEEQNKILERKKEREYKEHNKKRDDDEYNRDFAEMHKIGQTPVSLREYFNNRKG
jgi:hypothetical protein